MPIGTQRPLKVWEFWGEIRIFRAERGVSFGQTVKTILFPGVQKFDAVD